MLNNYVLNKYVIKLKRNIIYLENRKWASRNYKYQYAYFIL